MGYHCQCPGGYAGQNCDQDSTAALANYNTLTTVLALAAQVTTQAIRWPLRQ